MCGIIGYIGSRDCLPLLTDGLKTLEYRGYDSAGVAVMVDGHLVVVRSVGKLEALEKKLAGARIHGRAGLGHTRWATHGQPSEQNAHPHQVGPVAIVHNGIVENYLALKDGLLRSGATLHSETDTEIIVHLVDRHLKEGRAFPDAVAAALGAVRGYYAAAFLSETDPGTLVAARCGPPLVVGMGEGEIVVASDLLALTGHTDRVIFLEDGEVAVCTPPEVRVHTLDGTPRPARIERVTMTPVLLEKGRYRHFMLKEIYEQPQAITDTFRGRIDIDGGRVVWTPEEVAPAMLTGPRRLVLVACGTSYHAALVGKFLVEELARVPTEVDIGSEFRYRDPLIGPDDLVVLISQSGETADTLAALKEARARGASVLAVVNVAGSTLARGADARLLTHAGPEVGVASTKAFTTQLVALHLVALSLGAARGVLTRDAVRAHLDHLVRLPGLVERVLNLDPAIERLAAEIMDCTDVLYLGRGIHYPIALEGALKLKEISYIHAEGYPAGEMKHGPIALIDERMPVIILAPRTTAYEKVLANLEEVKARNGRVIAVVTEGDEAVAAKATRTLALPDAHHLISPIVMTVPLQLLAYHVALLKGTDVDQPRNLAKSVTVE